MYLGKVIGRVWATVKDPQLEGVQLSIIQPVNDSGEPEGGELVAADTMNASEGDLVYWVSGREAAYPFSDREIPSEVTIVGYVDKLNRESDSRSEGK